jgi:chemotaxis protein CheX
MFGMPLPDEMLASFAGEIGNMIAGNLSTNCSRKAFIIDISTPTVFENAPVYSAFAHVVSLPVELHETGRLSIILTAEQ